MNVRVAKRAGRAALVLVLAVGVGEAAAGGPGRVTVVRTPGGGIQPQAALDASGVIHLVYFTGNPAAGDVSYTRLEPGGAGFTPPVRVNSEPGSAVALGTIRGAQIALGRGGRVHVVWNGSSKARPENLNGGAPMLYARSDGSGKAFEPQRNLMRRTSALDGGGTVAANAEGHVIVAWHGRSPGAPEGESGRRMVVARSDDDGATFAGEEPAVARETGACPCCGTRALAASDGSVYVLFRAATGGTERDLTLLSSRDRGLHFTSRVVHPWKINMCPMSSESLAEGKNGVVAAWETQGQVYFARVDAATGEPSAPVHPRGSGGNRKHPAVAVSARGETILAWAEDTSFQHGGSLAWRVFDASGKATDEAGRVEAGIPTSSLPTVVARPDGGFTVIH